MDIRPLPWILLGAIVGGFAWKLFGTWWPLVTDGPRQVVSMWVVYAACFGGGAIGLIVGYCAGRRWY